MRRLEVGEAPGAVAGELEIDPGDPVVELERLRIVDGRPWSLVMTWIPLAVGEGLLDEDFRTESLYGLLEGKYGVTIAQGRRTIEAIAADDVAAEALGVHAGDPLLLLTSTAYDDDGTPVEHFVARHRADATSFEVSVIRRRPPQPLEPLRGELEAEHLGDHRRPAVEEVQPAVLGAHALGARLVQEVQLAAVVELPRDHARRASARRPGAATPAGPCPCRWR